MAGFFPRRATPPVEGSVVWHLSLAFGVGRISSSSRSRNYPEFHGKCAEIGAYLDSNGAVWVEHPSHQTGTSRERTLLR